MRAILAFVAILGLAAGTASAARKKKPPQDADAPRGAPVVSIDAPYEEDVATSGSTDDERDWEPPVFLPPAQKPAEVRGPSAPPTRGSSPVKISGVLFDGQRAGEPDPEEAIRLTNTDARRTIDIGDFAISDAFGPPRNTVAPPHSDTNAPRFVSFPSGTRLAPGQEIWVAYDGQAFLNLFGFKPDFEGLDTRTDVRQIEQRSEWPTWNSVHGVVSLHDAYGNLVDLVPYERSSDGDQLDKASIPKGSWTGPSILLFHAQPFGWTGQILARNRDVAGHVLPDTDTADDWDSSFSAMRLGQRPIHRVEFPGQSRLTFPKLDEPDVEVLCASAPENAFAALKSAIEGAKRELLIRIYQWENDHIADLVIAAKRRGVKVYAYLEGSPVGGMPDQERYITERLHSAGIPVWFLVTNEKDQVRNRYRFDHSKYLIIDGELSMIATENFGYTGHPVDPSYGNRGWMVHVRSKKFAAQLRQVWDADLDPKHHLDLVEISQDPSDNWGFPYKKPPFALRRAVVQGAYPLRRPPARVKGRVGLELVVCPDNCLSEEGAVIGLINSAKSSLFVVQNSAPLWWGQKNGGSAEHTPNLPLAAVIAAARRGVRVRVLLDGTWYNVEGYDPRDNDDTVRYLNELARTEHLNLEAKVINLVSTHVEKIHAKGVIADGERTFVGSINWTENSFKANREIGLVVDHPEVATYYATLFQRDWANTRLYQAIVGAKGGTVLTRPERDAAVVSKFSAGDVLDVMAENSGYLEVRLTEKATGYVPMAAIEEIAAVPEETPALVGRSARVTGRVRGTHVSKAGVHLNFGVNWRSDFSVFIPTSAVGAFQAAGVSLPKDFEGREIEVRGEISEKDGPSLTVSAPALVRVVR